MFSSAALAVELGRTSLLLAVIGVGAAVVLRALRVQSPAVHRVATCVTLLAGWTLFQCPVDVPWHAAQAPRVGSPLRHSVRLEPPRSEKLPLATALDDFAELPAAMAAPVATSLLPDVPDHSVATASADVKADVTDDAKWWSTLTWQQLAISAWASGMAGTVCWWLSAYLRFVWRLPPSSACEPEWREEWERLQQSRRSAAPIPLRVTESLGPLLCRLPRRNELLVPRKLWHALGAQERIAILRHELAHHERGDVWRSLAMRVLALPHWFNPIAWLAVRRFDEAAEWACDRAAMGEEPTVYARMLLRLGEIANPRAPLGSAMSNLPLTNRIRRLITLTTKKDSAMKNALVLSLLMLVVPLASVRVRLVAQQPEPASQSAPISSAAPATSVPATAPPQTPASEPGPVRKAELKMVETAEKAFEATRFAYDSGTTTLDPLVAWSTRWLSAELAVAETQEERIAAARANLQRIQKIHDAVKNLYQIGTRGGEAQQMETINYFLADAERRLAEIAAAPLGPRVGQPQVIVSANPDSAAQGVLTPANKPQMTLGGVTYAADDPALVPALRNVLRDRQSAELMTALMLVGFKVHSNDDTPPIGPRTEVATEIIALLDHPDKLIRDYAASTLLAMRSQVQTELETATGSTNPEIAQKARTLLAQKEPTPINITPAVPPPASQQVDMLNRELAEARRRLAHIEAYPFGQRYPSPSAVDPSSQPLHPQTRLIVPPAVDEQQLLYDGKTFDQWLAQLTTELSPKVREEAISAMGEFAKNGYGRRASEAIFQTVQNYPIRSIDHTVELSTLISEAASATKGVPTSELLPYAIEALQSDNVNLRLFALLVLPAHDAKDQIVPLLLTAMRDKDPRVARAARNNLAGLDHDNPELLAWLRSSLTSNDLEQILYAVHLAQGNMGRNPGGRISIRPFTSVVPEVVALVDHPEPAVRRAVEECFRLDTDLRAALADLAGSGAPQAANAGKLLEKVTSKRAFQPPVKVQ